MPKVLVAAIAQAHDAAQIETVLARSTDLDTSRIAVFKKEASGEAPAPLRMQCIPFRGLPVSSGTHGTNVPGMGATLVLSPYEVDACVDHLTEIGITYDAAHYYNTAIDEGRSVVTYLTTTEEAAAVDELFHACGFLMIRHFAQ